MQNVQYYLKQENRAELIATYYYHYPIAYDDTGYKDYTVDEIQQSYCNTMNEYIDHLINLDITAEKNNRHPILYANRCIDNDLTDGQEFNMIYLEDLLENGTNIPNYTYEFASQSEIMGFLVADTWLTQYYITDLLSSVLFEASFFGFKQEGLAEALNSIRIGEEDIKAGRTVSFDEWLRHYEEEHHVVVDRESSDEKEYHQKVCEAAYLYNEYSRKKELNQLKKMIIANRNA